MLFRSPPPRESARPSTFLPFILSMKSAKRKDSMAHGWRRFALLPARQFVLWLSSECFLERSQLRCLKKVRTTTLKFIPTRQLKQIVLHSATCQSAWQQPGIVKKVCSDHRCCSALSQHTSPSHMGWLVKLWEWQMRWPCLNQVQTQIGTSPTECIITISTSKTGANLLVATCHKALCACLPAFRPSQNTKGRRRNTRRVFSILLVSPIETFFGASEVLLCQA